MSIYRRYKKDGEVTFKQCKACLEWKPLSDEHFAHHKEGHLGLRAICRACLREQNRRYYPKQKKIRKSVARLSRDDPPRIQRSLSKEAASFLRAACQELGGEPIHKAYLVRNVKSNQYYVGITVRKLRERWRQHILTAINGNDGYLLHQAIRDYGLDSFEFIFVACARNIDDLYAVERQLIADYDSVRNGYNQTTGGGASEAVGKALIVDGREFISLNSAARYYGVPEYSVAQRLSRYGWTLEQALGIEHRPLKPPKRKKICVAGIEFPNMSQACQHFKIADSAVRRRLKSGWTLEQAFELAERPKGLPREGRTVEVAGVIYPSISAAARAYGVNGSTVKLRLDRGETVRQAFGLDERKRRSPVKGTSIILNGREFVSLAEAAREFGVDKLTAFSRLERGWTPEQAFGLHPPPERALPGKAITVGGIEYKSIAAAARAHGLSPQLVHKRMVVYGWPVQRAFGLE